VKGFADNLDEGSVKVVCEGEEEGMNELINSINSKTERLVFILDGMDVTLKSVKEDTKLIPSIKEK
jgi:acylphosphatase